MNKNKMPSRREVLKKLLHGAGYLTIGGLTWGAYINEAKSSPLILRPPAAIPEDDFLKACTKCGACVIACPYDTLKLAQAGDNRPVGTPFFEPRKIACEMCPDIPCVPVCPSGALDMDQVSTFDEEKAENIPNINKAKMGIAVIDTNSCVAHWGIQCDICYRVCPLMDEAITLKYEKNERTGKHANLIPVVNNEVCTGCGLCENACITEKESINILPLSIVLGKLGDHYIKSWDDDDEKRMKEKEQQKNTDEGLEKALDYLNSDWEDLTDD